jgi:beta-1,4-mannooligosaccharide/beta-1,4-mannosyl-N-acetylglucosamine phosphorylase
VLPFHGATSIEEGNVYSMGWCVLDRAKPEKVLYVSDTPALTPEAPYEIERNTIPQVDMANFRTGVRVVFPQGFVERGEDFLVYYGAADVSVAGARVNRHALVSSLEEAIRLKEGGVPQ